MYSEPVQNTLRTIFLKDINKESWRLYKSSWKMDRIKASSKENSLSPVCRENERLLPLVRIVQSFFTDGFNSGQPRRCQNFFQLDVTIPYLYLLERWFANRNVFLTGCVYNSPFYSCGLSTLTLEWMWGWRWPFFDRNLLCFVMEILVSIIITWFTW